SGPHHPVAARKTSAAAVAPAVRPLFKWQPRGCLSLAGAVGGRLEERRAVDKECVAIANRSGEQKTPAAMESPNFDNLDCGIVERRGRRKISFQRDDEAEDDDCDSGCGDFDNNLRLPDYRVSCAESLMSTTSANESCFGAALCSLSPATEDECRLALKAWARRHFLLCGGKIKEIKFRNISQRRAFQYSLDTYVETRNVHSAVEPLENLKNACRQFPQSLWDIECRPGGRPFESSEQRVAIPGTARVCVACHGSRRADCDTCFGGDFAGPGSRRLEFPSQAVYGRHACHECNETGEYGCPYCTGVGHLHCKACLGKGKLQRYMQLTVRSIFSKEVRQLSQAMLDYHAEQAKRTEARILRAPAQVLHAVPVTQVDYTWRGRNGTLWIYGNEQKCFCPIWRAPAAPCCK
uniref:Protein SSUH2 homolog n=1 Tax=Macrostomum lignano TaxID=282301 RepID=A0A1I8F9N5_9PLAT